MNKQEKQQLINDFTLYIENTSMIYDNVIMPLCNNLARKKFKGSYDDEKARRAWCNVVNCGLQRYFKDVYQKCYVDEYGYISAVGVVKSCQWQRNDINGNGIYKVVVERSDSGNMVTGTSQHTYCFHGWLEGKKVKAFYHVTPKRKAVKFDDFKVL